jgi:hypothetical protein
MTEQGPSADPATGKEQRRPKKGIWKGYILPIVVGGCFVAVGGFLSADVTLTLLRDEAGHVSATIVPRAFGFFEIREQRVDDLQRTHIDREWRKSITNRVHPEKERLQVFLALEGQTATIYHDYTEDGAAVDAFLREEGRRALVIRHTSKARRVLGQILAGTGVLLFWVPLLVVGIVWNSVAFLLRQMGFQAKHQQM